MAEDTVQASSGDPGLHAIVALLSLNGVGASADQVRHQFGARIGVTEILRCAKGFGLKAKTVSTTWERLAGIPMPCIGVLRDGGFLLLGKAGDDKIIVQVPDASKPTMMTRAEFEAAWDGRTILIAKRALLTDLTRRFDITWFLGAIQKYRGLLGEILVGSLFLQLFALVSPLLFQVVIDKVLVHRSMTTLDVLVTGLIAIALFEAILGGPICFRTRPIASMSSWEPGCFGTFWRFRSDISGRGASATPSRGCANWRISAIS